MDSHQLEAMKDRVNNRSYFLCWDGWAVETKRVYDCNGLEVGSPFPDEVADELDQYFERKSLTAPPVEMDYSITPNEVRALRDRQPCVVGGNDPLQGGILVPPEIAESILESLKNQTSTHPCWKCSAPTIRRLPDRTAECESCAEKPLF